MNSVRPIQIWVLCASNAHVPTELRSFLESQGSVWWSTLPSQGTELLQTILSNGPTGHSLPDWVVFLPAYTGQVTRAAVDTVRGLAPLATLFALSGPWSEGEIRTGPLPMGVRRVLWHEWQRRFSEASKGTTAVAGPHFRPATEQGVDSWLLSDDVRQRSIHPPAIPMVAIACRQRTDFETWGEALGSDAHAVWIQPELPSPILKTDVLVWCFEREVAFELTAFQSKLESLKVRHAVALVHFPRPEEIAALENLAVHVTCFALPAARQDFRQAVLNDTSANTLQKRQIPPSIRSSSLQKP